MKKIQMLACVVLSSFAALANADVSEGQARSALQTQASVGSARPVCLPDFLTKQEQQVNGALARADYLTAEARGEVLSANVAACALLAGNSWAQWADRAGRLLATAVIAATKVPGGLASPRTTASGERAEVLLSFAALNGSPTAAEVLKILQQSNYKKFN